jgi:hypothetical protein
VTSLPDVGSLHRKQLIISFLRVSVAEILRQCIGVYGEMFLISKVLKWCAKSQEAAKATVKQKEVEVQQRQMKESMLNFTGRS